ncbi:hypothetical protein M885DRAFT_498342 [Pelagophyceae sp. CCMP2097]|nr:hypothetical protein M885DRAFT_498342 [Pelagophyceae sp. CCMP2097]
MLAACAKCKGPAREAQRLLDGGEGQPRLQAIEGLRTLLCAWVLVYQYLWSPAKASPAHWHARHPNVASGEPHGLDAAVRTLSQRAYVAADVFFVISGYVAHVWSGPEQLYGRKFVLKTVLRLAPAYYVALVAVALVDHAMGTSYDFDPLELLMVQTWLPFYGRSAAPATRRSALEPDAWNTPCWFVSAFFGVVVIHAAAHALVLPKAAAAKARLTEVSQCLLRIVALCFLRMLPVLSISSNAVAVCEQNAKSAGQNAAADAADARACDWQFLPGAFSVFPPACYLIFAAGALTARLVELTPPSVARLKALLGVDVLIFASAAMIVVRVPPDSMLARAQTFGLTLLSCVLLWRIGVAGQRAPATAGAENDALLPDAGHARAEARTRGLCVRLLEHPALTAFGPWTFAVYAFHHPVAECFTDLRGWPRESPFTFFTFAFTLTALSAAFTHCVQGPWERLVTRFMPEYHHPQWGDDSQPEEGCRADGPSARAQAAAFKTVNI